MKTMKKLVRNRKEKQDKNSRTAKIILKNAGQYNFSWPVTCRVE